MGKRLKKHDWLAAGIDALVAEGPGALAAEPMARRIGTTKGSFYWHFDDVPTYHAALIDAWRTTALGDLTQAVASTQAADARLRQFGRTVLDDQTETAIRLWASSNNLARNALAVIDAERLTYLTLLLRELGLANPDFARALQAALIGLPQLGDSAPARIAAYDTLVDTVLAL